MHSTTRKGVLLRREVQNHNIIAIEARELQSAVVRIWTHMLCTARSTTQSQDRENGGGASACCRIGTYSRSALAAIRCDDMMQYDMIQSAVMIWCNMILYYILYSIFYTLYCKLYYIIPCRPCVAYTIQSVYTPYIHAAILYYTRLYYTILYYAILYYTILHYTMLYHIIS